MANRQQIKLLVPFLLLIFHNMGHLFNISHKQKFLNHKQPLKIMSISKKISFSELKFPMTRLSKQVMVIKWSDKRIRESPFLSWTLTDCFSSTSPSTVILDFVTKHRPWRLEFLRPVWSILDDGFVIKVLTLMRSSCNQQMDRPKIRKAKQNYTVKKIKSKYRCLEAARHSGKW